MANRKNNRNVNRTNVAICTDCNGSGIKKRWTEACTSCNATGNYVIKKKRPCECHGKHAACGKCHGSGKKTLFSVVPCRSCDAKGFRYETEYCATCGHEGSTRFHNKVKATVGSIGELWPSN